MTTPLALMHAAGWSHADVQPTNTLVTHDGHAAVIDYALACGPGDGRRVPYRGALTHTTAPEVATQILDTPDDTQHPGSALRRHLEPGRLAVLVLDRPAPRRLRRRPRPAGEAGRHRPGRHHRAARRPALALP
ncbi:hypothetical protein ACIRP2_39450 [Streptomyces sp. NPDC101194]|uniref:hypothetical protein n=1 Tax=Streptomyces sp. NPDC101194 TaxID=3366127 RepID=UPI00381CF1D0